MKEYNTAGPGAIITSAAAAIVMIAATALILPEAPSLAESGICFAFPSEWLPGIKGVIANTVLIGIAIIMAFFLNKKYSFVKGADVMLPVAMCVLLASNPLNTERFSASVVMLIVNLVCLDIIMKSYHSRNATTEMFAVATYLALGSMIEYGFLPLMLIYPIMALMIKAFRVKELLAYIMGLLAPYWVALGFGLATVYDFRLPEFLTVMPTAEDSYLIFCYISLGLMALIGLIMTLNNALLFYSGNIRIRTYNNIINLLGVASALCILMDFDNIEAYSSTFCFAAAVSISNFFAIRRIPRSAVWFWSLLSIFILLFILMLL